jgi:hypothetical protein
VIASIFADQSTVSGFARAPVGCVTTIEVDEPVMLYVYVETRGRVDDIGDCDNDDRSYEVEIESEIAVNFVDEAGDTIPQIPIDEEVSYDLPDYAGRAIGRVVVENGERYDVVVESNGLGPVVAIGQRIVPVESGLAIAGAIVVMVGVVLLGVALVISAVSRRRRARGPWEPPTPDDRAVW